MIREMKEGGFSEDVAKQIDSKFIESTKFVYEKEFLAKKKGIDCIQTVMG